MKDISKIPKGLYCYDENGKCPYWSLIKNLPIQENGYCSFLKKSDYDLNEEQGEIHGRNRNNGEFVIPTHFLPLSLLWDQCKECGINMDDK
jgi:hypothetical protein